MSHWLFDEELWYYRVISGSFIMRWRNEGLLKLALAYLMDEKLVV